MKASIFSLNASLEVIFIRYKYLSQAFFFQHFRENSTAKKNSIFALSEKTQGHFWPKTQSWGSFYLMNKEEKTQIFVKNSKYGEKTQDFPSKLNTGAASGC